MTVSQSISHGLNLISGNRLEHLADALAELLCPQEPGNRSNPLVPEVILVQSKGMQRWLSMAIARKNGICANTIFPFPNAFLKILYTYIGGPLMDGRCFEPEVLTFRILTLLPKLIDNKVFQPIEHYLNIAPHPLTYYQLAKKIAGLFDQYLVFRPDLILAWEKGRGQINPSPDHIWQMHLWRNLMQDTPVMHRAGLHQDLLKRLSETIPHGNSIPSRVSVFGISHLPPFHLQVLEALSRHIPVHLFLLNPCREFWFDIVSEKGIVRKQSRLNDLSHDLHFERGNSLLASWGQLGRQFFNLVHNLDCQTKDLFNDNNTDSMLGRIQQDILGLDENHHEQDDANRSLSVTAADSSIRIHSCHSAMREVEVLYDQLLDIFEHHPDIHPSDVLVLISDMVTYAPFVNAVFNADRLIPYSMADQRIQEKNNIVDGFLQLMTFHRGRFEVSRLMTLLENQTIRSQFDLEEGDLQLIHTWLTMTNIRWGWDQKDRKRHGLPGFRENTWRQGLDRLLAGYAMAPDGATMFHDILPVLAVEGNESRILGGLVAFTEALMDYLIELPEKAPLSFWGNYFFGLTDRFLCRNDVSEQDHQALRDNIQSIIQIADIVGSDSEITFEVISSFLTDQLGGMTVDGGFLVGGVTFCAALPMRSIPAKVICLIGLHHDAFPKESHEPSFNLISAHPRPGDRSKRDDDKYLFLEALISSRTIFYISYIGRSIQDNAIIPPSVVVDELIDHISDNYKLNRDDLILQHPLQAFSPVYFGDNNPRLFSYSKENFQACSNLSDPIKFMGDDLGRPAETFLQCNISELCDFFSHPTRYLFQQRLGLSLQEPGEVAEDRENFNLDGLGEYIVAQQVLREHLAGYKLEQTYPTVKASGNLPHGTVGKALHEKISLQVGDFCTLLTSRIPPKPADSLTLDIPIDRFHLVGTLTGTYPHGLIDFRMARLRPHDLISFFLKHLCLHLIQKTEQTTSSMLICKDWIWKLGAIRSDPLALMKKYLSLYWEGLHRPLSFFPKSGFAYAEKLLMKSASREAAFSSAMQTWLGTAYIPGESNDPYYRRCYGASKSFPNDFEEISLTVYDPIILIGRQVPADTVP